MKKILLSVAGFLLAATSAMAQVVVKTNDGNFSLRLIGRTNLDYGRYINHSDNLDYGFKMNDTRLGVVANFDQKWSAKAEICYANKAVSFRDLWIGYKINDKMSLTGGNHFQPFGAKILGLNYKFIQDAQADFAICPSRKIGVSYDYTTNPFKATAGIYSDANIDNLGGANGKNQGYSVAAKLIGRPICSDSSVLHFGVAGMYTDVANDYKYSVTQPETFVSNELTSYTSKLDNTININRFEAEMIYIIKRFYFETHYLNAMSNLIGNENFQMQGAYAQASFLVLGNKQNYNKKTGLATNNSPKSLEVLARIDHANFEELKGPLMVDDEATGELTVVSPEQKVTDFTLGVNYFINKNLNARLNYTVAKVKEDKGAESTNNAIQARLQFSF